MLQLFEHSFYVIGESTASTLPKAKRTKTIDKSEMILCYKINYFVCSWPSLAKIVGKGWGHTVGRVCIIAYSYNTKIHRPPPPHLKYGTYLSFTNSVVSLI